ncbi:MAG: hypothetical protein E7314_02110 [Clostridiales bacterium]|nr:hypothetical protein [Clostridiales bacterium]
MNSIDKNWVNEHIDSNGVVIIPDGVSVILRGVFQGNDRIKRVIMPESIIGLDVRTFAECTNLQEVTMSNNIEQIGMNSFRNCSQLKSITIPDKVKLIYPKTFVNNTNLESITLNGNFEYLSADAFVTCDNLVEVNINGTERIDYNAFAGKENVKRIVIDGREISISENEQLIAIQKAGEKVAIVMQSKETGQISTQCINLEKNTTKILNFNTYLTDDGKLCYARHSLADASLDYLKKLKENGHTQLYICGGECEITPEQHDEGINLNLYNIDDLINIKLAILELKKQIQVPSSKDPNREKKIYSQIVRVLSENIEYDDWAAKTSKEEYEEKTGKSYNEYVAQNEGRDKAVSDLESRSLVGLLHGAAVCHGFAEIIRNIAAEYGIQVDCVRGVAGGEAHEWNQVKLDGIWYDDDFTNYRRALVDGKLDECHTFLLGTRPDGEVHTKVSGMYKTSRRLHDVGKSVPRADRKILLNYGRGQQQEQGTKSPEKSEPEFTDLQKAIKGYSNPKEYRQACIKSEIEHKQKSGDLDRKIEIAIGDR